MTKSAAASQPFSALAPDMEERAWQQVLSRDPRADGRFVYAVSTTGVYCRTTCPSRRPAREHVRFFRTVQDAEAAGFRACLRCKPSQQNQANGTMGETILKRVQQAASALQSGEARSLEELAREAGVSKFALLRGFQRALGVTPKEFGRAERRERLVQALRGEGQSVTGALYAAGFGSSSRLYEGGTGMLGMLPSTMRRGGEGAEIRFTIVESPLDRMLVAVTAQGVCAVAFAAEDAALRKELQERFPKATLTQDDGSLTAAVRTVLKVLGGEPLAASGLKLDVRRTAFQERVWQALQAIPRGKTRTYGEVAADIGSPQAVRAVGTACGDNPVAVLIPCHRVLAKGGKTHNYRWGVERKERLLRMEGADRDGR